MITDREKRLMRALTRLGIAGRLVGEASNDVIACMNHLAPTIEKLERRVKWMKDQVVRELERKDVSGG